ncbi:hypothetical protein [Bradyrhizobium sp. CSS354]|uniref:hypothetical protein n=1 Tax=Bradyrhizobium sp. CSS354 TaxID=2699172 RepID=UPI0023B1C91C|nr:hypothetical protein [Bradyrhizobium sp. CSS354]MDE5465968.1 hypothetical protein [Bradyrhizobium sp. CSS354]
MDSDRQYAVARLLFDYVKSPSLRHLRDPHSVHKLARDIVTTVDRAGSVWSKWDAQREEVAKAAAPCWIPTEDLLASLNNLPGPQLTKTDVEQRLRAIWEEPYTSYPNEDLKEGCRALYLAEKALGTEMRAIIGMLQEHLEREDERLRREQEDRYRKLKEEERLRLEERFLSGSDCGWTPVGGSGALYCRRNGRTFRIVQDKDKRWTLYRIKAIDDKGDLLGVYQGRGDASTALKTIAYAKES